MDLMFSFLNLYTGIASKPLPASLIWLSCLEIRPNVWLSCRAYNLIPITSYVGLIIIASIISLSVVGDHHLIIINSIIPLLCVLPPSPESQSCRVLLSFPRSLCCWVLSSSHDYWKECALLCSIVAITFKKVNFLSLVEKVLKSWMMQWSIGENVRMIYSIFILK